MAKTKSYPGTLEQRGHTFRVILQVGGQRHSFTAATEDLEEARQFAKDKDAELRAQLARQRQGLPGVVRFSALLDQFQREEVPTLAAGTRDAYGDSFKPIREFFVDRLEDPTLERIRAREVKAFLSWRRTHRYARSAGSPKKRRTIADPAPVSNRTLQKDRAVLHRLFAFAEDLEYREGNPAARVQAPKSDGRDPVLLTDDQYEALLAECAERPMLRLYALLLGETGVRSYSEALFLRWEDVDLREGFLWIASGREGHRTKSGKGRWCPMTPRLHQAMREHFATYRLAVYPAGRSEWIFHHLTTRRHFTAGERIRDMKNAFDRAAERAKIPEGFHRHDLRHRRVTTWLAAGANPVHVREAMGHSDLRTTMGYTHLSKEHLRSLVDVPARAPAQPEPARA